MGIENPNAPLDLSNPGKMANLIGAMAPQETQPVVPGIVMAGVNMGLGTSSGPSGPLPAPAAGTGMRTASGAFDATVTIDINHKNAPPGSTVTAKSSNSNVKTGTVKVEQAMLTTF